MVRPVNRSNRKGLWVHSYSQGLNPVNNGGVIKDRRCLKKLNVSGFKMGEEAK